MPVTLNEEEHAYKTCAICGGPINIDGPFNHHVDPETKGRDEEKDKDHYPYDADDIPW